MAKIYKTIFSRFAEEDLVEIIEYFYPINTEYSKKLLVLLEKRVNEFKNNPERGRVVPELEKQNIVDYRELIEGNYRIVYAIQDQTVVIHTIIDARRNFEELIIKKLMRLYLRISLQVLVFQLNLLKYSILAKGINCDFYFYIKTLRMTYTKGVL